MALSVNRQSHILVLVRRLFGANCMRLFWETSVMTSRVSTIVSVGICAFVLLSLTGCKNDTASLAKAEVPNDVAKTGAAIAAIAKDGVSVAPLMKQAAAQEFLKGVAGLNSHVPRIVYTDAKTRRTITPTEYDALKPADREGYARVEHDEAFYYATFYGSPVAYAAAFEAAGKHGLASLTSARILDIGYGAMGGPQMMAGAGAAVSAVDVDPLLKALYRESADQGAVKGFDGRAGSVTLFDGLFAGSTTLTKLIGGNFNLIVSKNTMKRGFMRPEGDRNPLVSFGASDEVFLDTIYDSLAPNGILVIYNIAGALDPAKPSTDGRSPFTREQFSKANLNVLAFDTNDDAMIRSVGKALGWEKPMGDLEKNLFALYTVVQRAK
jgi:hypothetical protein